MHIARFIIDLQRDFLASSSASEHFHAHSAFRQP
jgi:hypothetical protein